MKKFDQINIIPFIDVMLVLLAIVLITATFVPKNKIKVNIPKSNSTEVLKPNDFKKSLTITKHGLFYHNNKSVTLEFLDKELGTWDKLDNIILNIDSTVKFQSFVSMTDLLARHELAKISVIVLNK